MARFNSKAVQPKITQPVTTIESTRTYEGGTAWKRDPRSELVLLAVVNMVGQSTFYESADDRDNRFVGLCRAAALADPAWFLNFVRWLRGDANMRSASLVAAAEGVKARLDAGVSEPFLETVTEHPDRVERRLTGSRTFINAALQRADEPGEFVGYWQAKYGTNLPMPVKRGLADAAARLYNERSLLKYDTETYAIRFADVIELSHVKGTAPWQHDLFQYAMHRRPRLASPKGHKDQVPESLTVVKEFRRLVSDKSAAAIATDWLDPEVLRGAGMTWEDVLPVAGNKAKTWEALIPNMGIMALIRNLRNFDEAGVSDEAAQLVISRLQDPEQIRKSRQFPYRFLSAYRAAPSLRWAHALERAMDASLANVPRFKGKSLVLVDTSGSMLSPVSDKSKVRHVDVGALVGVTLAARSVGDVDLVQFATTSRIQRLPRAGSVLRGIEQIVSQVGQIGYGTNTVQAIQNYYNGHDRVIVVTDGQAFMAWGGGGSVSGSVPADVPLFGIDTTGYSRSSIDTSKPNRYEIGGFSDKLFTMISLLDGKKSAKWPWE